MARTKQRVLDDHRTAAQKHAAREAAARRAAAIRKAARMLSTQELYELPSQKHSDIDSDEDGSTEENSAEVCAACTLDSNIPFIFVFTACAVCACMPPRVLFAGLLLAGVGGSCILRVCLRESPALGSGSTSAGGGGGRLGRRGAWNLSRARGPPLAR